MKEKKKTAQYQPEYNPADHLRPWQFKPGQSGNPGGKPKGAVSLKEYARKMLYELTEEGRLEYMKGLDKDLIWKMAEGMPPQEFKGDIDVKSKVVKLDE